MKYTQKELSQKDVLAAEAVGRVLRNASTEHPASSGSHSGQQSSDPRLLKVEIDNTNNVINNEDQGVRSNMEQERGNCVTPYTKTNKHLHPTNNHLHPPTNSYKWL